MLNWSRFLGTCRRNPGRTLCAGIALMVLPALIFADALLAEPLRSRAVRMMNAHLKGYTVRIAKVRPHLWRLGCDLENLELLQNAHPEPPVANIGVMAFSLAWGQLVRFKLAGDLAIRRPDLHIDLPQIKEETGSKVRLRDRGWQGAVESVYPIKLDRVTIQDGSLLYLSSRTAGKPLQFTRISMVTSNIRNIAAIQGTFPSPVTLDGMLFDTGKVRFQGAADFLREPYIAARGEIHLDRVPLDRLAPLAQDYQLKATGGYLSVDGTTECTPEARAAHLTKVRIEGLRLDYITSKATRALEAEQASQAAKLARSVRNAPSLLLRVDSLSLTHGEIGFVDESSKPPYRLFMSEVNLNLDNLSNQADLGRSSFQARGAFMGHGATVFSGGFQPNAHPLDFAVRLQMDGARLPDLNDFLLAHTGIDTAAGQFSIYAEVTVKDARVNGYLKPMLKDVKIYDRRKDAAKSLPKRLELHLLQGLVRVFKNHSTQEVATVTTLSGSTSQPRAGEWEAIRRLLGNGLYRAILPGFLAKPQPKKP